MQRCQKNLQVRNHSLPTFYKNKVVQMVVFDFIYNVHMYQTAAHKPNE